MEDRSLSFPPCFPAAALDFGTLALREAPGFPDLLILLVPSFPLQRYSISEKRPFLSLAVALTQPLVLTASPLLAVVMVFGVSGGHR